MIQQEINYRIIKASHTVMAEMKDTITGKSKDLISKIIRSAFAAALDDLMVAFALESPHRVVSRAVGRFPYFYYGEFRNVLTNYIKSDAVYYDDVDKKTAFYCGENLMLRFIVYKISLIHELYNARVLSPCDYVAERLAREGLEDVPDYLLAPRDSAFRIINSIKSEKNATKIQESDYRFHSSDLSDYYSTDAPLSVGVLKSLRAA